MSTTCSSLSYDRPDGDDRSATPSAPRTQESLRATVHVQSRKGEELYEKEQYAMAVACFNDARFALLTLKREREGPVGVAGLAGAARCANVRDQINSVSARTCVVLPLTERLIGKTPTFVESLGSVQPFPCAVLVGTHTHCLHTPLSRFI